MGYVLPQLVTVAAESGSGTSGIQTALTNAMTTTAGDIQTMIGNVLPIVLPIVGAILLVTVGIRLFKRFGKG